MWINLGITAVAVMAVLGVALVRHRLPRSLVAATTVAKATLVLTVVVTAWVSVVVPILPVDFVAGAGFEHVTLAATGVGTVVVAAAAWAGR